MNKPYKASKYSRQEKEDIKDELFDVKYPIGDTTYDTLECREIPVKPPKRAPAHPSQCPKRVDVEKLFKRLMTVLNRETAALMTASYSGKLTKEEVNALISYLKLAKELKNKEEKDLENLSTEELEALTNGNK